MKIVDNFDEIEQEFQRSLKWAIGTLLGVLITAVSLLIFL